MGRAVIDMTKRQGFRGVLFFVVLGIILSNVIRIFGIPLERDTWNMTRFNEFYEEPENTWDCVIIGTSCVDRGWAPPLAWNEYGMTVYNMATGAQPIILVTGLLEEVRKTQDVQLAIVDVRGARLEDLHLPEARIRRVTDAMKYSVNRQKMIKNVLDFSKDFYTREEVRNVRDVEKTGTELDEASLYFPFLKYHSRWETGLDQTDFVKQVTDTKGVFDFDERAFHVKAMEKPELYADVTEELLDIQKEVLDDILEYGEDTDLEILFISTPVFGKKKEQIELNNIIQYLEEKGTAVLNFNTEEKYKETGLDFSTDFYNKYHLNARGAAKFTRYLAGYLNENYDFEDKRGREEYRDWDEAYERYVKFYEEGWK